MRLGYLTVRLIMAGLTLTPLCLSAHERAKLANSAEHTVSRGNDPGSRACASCHGSRGEGDASSGAPRLSGLSAAYSERQLDAYAIGRRTNALMEPIAQALTAQERRAISVHYAKIRGARPSRRAAPPPGEDIGRELATRGRWRDELPACVACHGNGGSGVGANFPPLAGQPSSYLVNQLRAWQTNSRDPGPLGLMGGIAEKLSDRDIQAVARYFGEIDAPVSRVTR